MGRTVRRLLHGLRELWVALGITLLLLAVGEGSARLALRLRARPWSDPRLHADSYPAEPWVAELYEETNRSSRLRWESYAYWRRLPFAGQHINIDERGLRRTWRPANPNGAQRPRVFFFGASVVWGTGVRDDHTIPSELARYLAAAGFPAEVVNYGETGYVSTQAVVTLLRELQRGAVPDVVVYYGGENDAASSYFSRAAGVPLSEQRRIREFNILRHARRLVPAALRVIAARSAMVQLLGVQISEPFPAIAPELATPQLVDLTLRALDVNLAAMDGLARSYGFRTSYFWEPCLLQKPNRTRYEEDRTARLAFSRAWLPALYARVQRDWATRDPDEFTYLGELFANTTEPRFIDHFHTSELANQEIAAVIGRQLIERGRLMAPSNR